MTSEPTQINKSPRPKEVYRFIGAGWAGCLGVGLFIGAQMRGDQLISTLAAAMAVMFFAAAVFFRERYRRSHQLKREIVNGN